MSITNFFCLKKYCLLVDADLEENWHPDFDDFSLRNIIWRNDEGYMNIFNTVQFESQMTLAFSKIYIYEVYWCLFKTSKPLCQIREILKIRSRFFKLRSNCYHAEWLKRVSECSGRLGNFARFVHSAGWLWRHNQNKITEFFTRFLLAPYVHLLASFVRQWHQKDFDSFEKPRHGGSLSSFYIR